MDIGWERHIEALGGGLWLVLIQSKRELGQQIVTNDDAD